jgi:RNA polymerase sigma factor (TIGR02999 family)
MAVDPAPETLQSLMAAFREGDSQAGARLMELLYPELRRLAAFHMQGERSNHSWQPTVLINELYLELIKIKALRPAQSDRQNDKVAFFSLAGQIMKRLLIHHARTLSHKAHKVSLDEETVMGSETGLVEVEDLLCRLALVKPVLRTVVEMKVFEGLTAEEIAAQLGCATVTVNRYWQFARHWLKMELAMVRSTS